MLTIERVYLDTISNNLYFHEPIQMFLIYYRLVNIFLFDSLQGKAHNLFKVLIEMIYIPLLIQYIMQMIALTDIMVDRQKTLNNINLATCNFCLQCLILA